MELLWIHFKAEPTASVDRLHVKCEERERGEDNSETVSLSSFENGGTAGALEGIQLKGGASTVLGCQQLMEKLNIRVYSLMNMSTCSNEEEVANWWPLGPI